MEEQVRNLWVNGIGNVFGEYYISVFKPRDNGYVKFRIGEVIREKGEMWIEDVYAGDLYRDGNGFREVEIVRRKIDTYIFQVYIDIYKILGIVEKERKSMLRGKYLEEDSIEGYLVHYVDGIEDLKE